jgi:hypothetical protein
LQILVNDQASMKQMFIQLQHTPTNFAVGGKSLLTIWPGMPAPFWDGLITTGRKFAAPGAAGRHEDRGARSGAPGKGGARLRHPNDL